MHALFPAAAAFNIAVGAPPLAAPALVYRLGGRSLHASLREARTVGLLVVLFGALFLGVPRRAREAR